MAIPYLHVLREHPVTLKRYSHFFANNLNSHAASLSKTPSIFEKIRKLINYFSYFGRGLSNELISFRSVDVIIVSHLINIDHLNSDNDFYFQNISDFLNDNNVNCLFLLIDHTTGTIKNPINFFSRVEGSRIILPRKIGFNGEMLIIFKMIKEFILMKITSLNEKGLLKEVLKNSSNFKEIESSLFALRLGSQVKEALKFYAPKAIMTTFEGHSWERVLFKVANDYDGDLLRMGYQHSIVTKRAYAIARPLGREYDPDIIFTSGDITNLFFKKLHKNYHSKIVTLGSRKKSAYLSNTEKVKKKVCVVLPEGVVEECEKLFRFSIKCAQEVPNMEFIWRLHPVISFKEVFHYMSINELDLPGNITISNSSIDDDILNSKFALYRGTTAIVEAIYGKVIPIYLAIDDEMTIDLLYEFDVKYRKIVFSVDDFIEIANSEKLQFDTSLIDYCHRYFMPFNFKPFMKVLKSIF